MRNSIWYWKICLRLLKLIKYLFSKLKIHSCYADYIRTYFWNVFLQWNMLLLNFLKCMRKWFSLLRKLKTIFEKLKLYNTYWNFFYHQHIPTSYAIPANGLFFPVSPSLSYCNASKPLVFLHLQQSILPKLSPFHSYVQN